MTSATYPASLTQRLLWQAAFRSPADATATPRQYSIRDLDAAALQRALTQLRTRHEALRTRLLGAGSRLAQEVSEPSPFPVEWVDDRDGCEHADVTGRQAGQEVLARVWRRPGESSLLLDIDHLLTDAWSNNVLTRELAQLYAAYRAGTDTELPPVGWQYRHFAEWQLSRLRGEGLQRLQAGWQNRLAGAQPVALPWPAERPPRRERIAAVHHFRGDREAAQALAALGVSADTTASCAAVAMFFLELSLITGQHDMSIGSIFANRSSRQSWRTIGSFAHLLPLRLKLGPDLTVHELLRRTHEMMAHALANQELPMSLLPAGTLSRATAVGVNNVVINILPRPMTPEGGASAPGGEGTITPAAAQPARGARFDLELCLFSPGGSLNGFMRYATDRFSAGWVAEFCRLLPELILLAVADPAVSLGRITRRLPQRVDYLRDIA
jgi:hypothetical protein